MCLEASRSTQSIGSCLNVIINLIKCSGSVGLCNQYIEYVLTHYPKLHGLESEKRDLFYSGFFTMAHVLTLPPRSV